MRPRAPHANFAACALCEEGTALSGAPPWQWSATWANAITIGAEMGDEFGRGLLRAAGVTGDELDLSQKIGGDRQTAMRAVAQLAVALTSLKYAASHSDATLAPGTSDPLPCS